MRFFSTIRNFALAATFTSAMPVDSAASDTPATTAVDWYQGSPTFSGTSAVIDATGTCATKVSSGTMTADGCHQLYTYAFGVHHNPNLTCNYRLWKGKTDCSGDDWVDIPIPADSDVTCINDGVLDGGRFYHASGMYFC